MEYTCVVCGEIKRVSAGYLTKKERLTGVITCGRCRRIAREGILNER